MTGVPGSGSGNVGYYHAAPAHLSVGTVDTRRGSDAPFVNRSVETESCGESSFLNSNGTTDPGTLVRDRVVDSQHPRFNSEEDFRRYWDGRMEDTFSNYVQAIEVPVFRSFMSDVGLYLERHPGEVNFAATAWYFFNRFAEDRLDVASCEELQAFLIATFGGMPHAFLDNAAAFEEYWWALIRTSEGSRVVHQRLWFQETVRLYLAKYPNDLLFRNVVWKLFDAYSLWVSEGLHGMVLFRSLLELLSQNTSVLVLPLPEARTEVLTTLRSSLEHHVSFGDSTFRRAIVVRTEELLTPDEASIYNEFLNPEITRPHERDIERGSPIVRYVRWVMVWNLGLARCDRAREIIAKVLTADLAQISDTGASHLWEVLDSYMGEDSERDRIKAILVGKSDVNQSEALEEVLEDGESLFLVAAANAEDVIPVAGRVLGDADVALIQHVLEQANRRIDEEEKLIRLSLQHLADYALTNTEVDRFLRSSGITFTTESFLNFIRKLGLETEMADEQMRQGVAYMVGSPYSKSIARLMRELYQYGHLLSTREFLQWMDEGFLGDAVGGMWYSLFPSVRRDFMMYLLFSARADSERFEAIVRYMELMLPDELFPTQQIELLRKASQDRSYKPFAMMMEGARLIEDVDFREQQINHIVSLYVEFLQRAADKSISRE